MTTITLIGAGRMGSAMLRGWLKSSAGLRIQVIARSPSDEILGYAARGLITLNPSERGSDITIIAVKPQGFSATPDFFADYAQQDTLVISVMAGISLARLAKAFDSPKIVRAMPNTPGGVGQGVTLLTASGAVTPEGLALTKSLFEPLGHVEGPMSEAHLQTGTAISGCGPAYVFYFADMLAQAGVKAGLDANQAARLARQTVVGAAHLMAQDDTSFEDLREAVASPGGVTRAALDVMMDDHRLGDIMVEAIRAAIARDSELSG